MSMLDDLGNAGAGLLFAHVCIELRIFSSYPFPTSHHASYAQSICLELPFLGIKFSEFTVNIS